MWQIFEEKNDCTFPLHHIGKSVIHLSVQYFMLNPVTNFGEHTQKCIKHDVCPSEVYVHIKLQSRGVQIYSLEKKISIILGNFYWGLIFLLHFTKDRFCEHLLIDFFLKSFSVERELQDNSTSYPDEPWRITEEQREYYVNQFRSLQPDPSSFISGNEVWWVRTQVPAHCLT